MSSTVQQYKDIINNCRELFQNKTKDYGTAWRILRASSLTDQIFIKAQRIRTIQDTGENKVGEDIGNEFVGIINYCIMAQLQLELPLNERLELPLDEVTELYDGKAEETFQLMLQKNHDYGEAWRDMRVSSLTDLILMKLLRVKQIEDNEGSTIVSEGIDANYQDMLNYAVFALILMSEEVK
jgi:hypothetical protein